MFFSPGKILLSGLLLLSLSTTGAVVLVQDGIAQAGIVLSRQATRSAQFAAAELQYHIEKITGTRLPIEQEPGNLENVKIFVGESDFTRQNGFRSEDFKEQEYLLSVQPDSIILAGSDRPDFGIVDYADEKTFPDSSTRDIYGQGGTGGFHQQGTCYAVYDFLEDFCGVRWYSPTELGLDFIPRKTLTVEAKRIRRIPDSHHRMLIKELGVAQDFCGDTVDGGVTEVLDRREMILWARRMRLGGTAFACNHSLYGYYARFLKTNPEWFAQGYEGRPPQLCYTAPGLIQQVAQDARDFFDGKLRLSSAYACGDFFSVMPMDNLQICKCPRCQSLIKTGNHRGRGVYTDRLSKYYFSFVNQVAKELAKTHPGKWITTAAYNYSAYPPEEEKMADNVAVVLCLGIRQPYNRERRENDLEILRAWQNKAPDHIKSVWLYFCYPALDAVGANERCFPGFFSRDLLAVLEEFRKSGIRGFIIEPSYMKGRVRNALMDQLELFLISKLFYNAGQDGKMLRNEFFQRYFGAAEAPMKQIYSEMEEAFCDATVEYPDEGVQTQAVAWENLGTETRMNRWNALFTTARGLAENEKEKKRLELFEKGIIRYMNAGREAYLQTVPVREKTAGRTILVPESKRDNWSEAVGFGDFYTVAGETPKCRVEGKMKHDGEKLYIQMTASGTPDSFPPVANPAHYNDGWWLYFARQRSRPYHQLLVEPNGEFTARAHRITVEEWKANVSVKTSSEDTKRSLELIFPLSSLLPGGVKPDDTIFFNIIRANPDKEFTAWIPPFTAGRDAPSRFGVLHLK